MFNFHKNHVQLVLTIFVVFLLLSVLIAVTPAYEMQNKVQALPGQKEMLPNEREGLYVYVKENCMACHTQQVRGIEMDKVWGSRPSIPSDYVYSKIRQDVWRQSPSILGSERTGPDLTNVGQRQPGVEWHLLHLYNPRIVVKESIMPSYPWFFIEKDSVEETDIVVPVPTKYLKNKNKKIVASKEVLDLLAYLQSLKQNDLPEVGEVNFIPFLEKTNTTVEGNSKVALPDGESLYIKKCAACHQSNGEGIPGAFPSLKGSPIVNDNNSELMIKIILQGYDARTEFGVMPSFSDQLTDEEIVAIANHERTSWGNNAEVISVEDVKRIRDYLLNLNQ